MKFLSVIIPTRNRHQYLEKLVGSICQQTYPSDAFEIILVDNDSTDNTKNEIKRLQNVHPTRSIIYVYEPIIGVANARNTGAKIAKGDILVFIDDDAYAAPDWLEKLAAEFDRDQDVVCVGGRINLHWESPRPLWFPEEFLTYLGCNNYLGIKRREFPPGEAIFEGNFSTYRNIMLDVGGFDTRFGMVGNRIFTHAGTTLVDRLKDFGKAIYSPDAVVYHIVPETRTKQMYILRRGFRQGMSDAVLWFIRQEHDKKRLLRSFASDAVFISKELLSLFLMLASRKDRIFYRLVVLSIRFGVIYQKMLLLARSDGKRF